MGAGLVGTYLAHRLLSSGLSIALIERGTSNSSMPAANETSMVDAVYRGATVGRTFGLGGTSNRWGGQLVPLFSTAPETAELGRQVASTLNSEYRTVWKILRLREELYDDLFAHATTQHPLDRIHSFALPVRKRNFWTRFGADISAHPSAAVFTSATDVEVRVGESSMEVKCRSEAKDVSLEGQYLVISAGAIESTVLVGALTRSLGHEWKFGSPLRDHLSVRIGALTPLSLDAFRSAFSPTLRGGGMVFSRYAIANESPAAFIHCLYDESSDFPSWMHACTQAFQQRSQTLLPLLTQSAAKAQGLMTFAAGLAFRRRVEWPRGTRYSLQLDIEQRSDARNYIGICSSDKRPELSWNVRPADWASIRDLKKKVEDLWKDCPLGRVANLAPLNEDELIVQSRIDAHHPIGTLAEECLDDWITYKRGKNTFVLSTATFPFTGISNPTFTLLALAERLAKRITSA